MTYSDHVFTARNYIIVCIFIAHQIVYVSTSTLKAKHIRATHICMFEATWHKTGLRPSHVRVLSVRCVAAGAPAHLLVINFSLEAARDISTWLMVSDYPSSGLSYLFRNMVCMIK